MRSPPGGASTTGHPYALPIAMTARKNVVVDDRDPRRSENPPDTEVARPAEIRSRSSAMEPSESDSGWRSWTTRPVAAFRFPISAMPPTISSRCARSWIRGTSVARSAFACWRAHSAPAALESFSTRQYERNAAVCRAKRDDIKAQINYLEANRQRMNYHLYRDDGLLIGSGSVESACKNVVARIKRNGTTWTLRGELARSRSGAASAALRSKRRLRRVLEVPRGAGVRAYPSATLRRRTGADATAPERPTAALSETPAVVRRLTPGP